MGCIPTAISYVFADLTKVIAVDGENDHIRMTCGRRIHPGKGASSPVGASIVVHAPRNWWDWVASPEHVEHKRRAPSSVFFG